MLETKKKYAFKFIDDSYYPFLGEHRGKRLLYISNEYWQEFLDSLEDFMKSDEYNPNNMLGRLIAYAKRRVKVKEKKYRDMGLLRGLICINDGINNKYIKPEDAIPEGFVVGSLYNNLVTFRDKVLEGYKAFLKTPEGKKYLSDHFKNISKKSSRNKGKTGKRWINNGISENLHVMSNPLPEGYSFGRLWNLGASTKGIVRSEKFKNKVSRGVKKYYRDMKKHTKIYMTHFKYDTNDFMPCEICGKKAVDIHHIESRGMGGTSKEDTIQNLMAVCREGHLKFGDKKHHLEFLKDAHKYFMEFKTPFIDGIKCEDI